MFAVHEKPIAEVASNYLELAGALKEHDRIIITNGGQKEAVLIGMEDYAEYELYAHNRYVHQKLAEAETQASGAAWVSEADFWGDDESE